MKRNYYKLNLEGSVFWQSNVDGTLTKKHFTKRENNDLNNIYFRKIDETTYEERLSNFRLQIVNNEVVYPKGIIVDLSLFTPATSSEVLESFNRLKHANLNVEYFKIITDLLQYSHYCEMVEDKKEKIL